MSAQKVIIAILTISLIISAAIGRDCRQRA